MVKPKDMLRSVLQSGIQLQTHVLQQLVCTDIFQQAIMSILKYEF